MDVKYVTDVPQEDVRADIKCRSNREIKMHKKRTGLNGAYSDVYDARSRIHNMFANAINNNSTNDRSEVRKAYRRLCRSNTTLKNIVGKLRRSGTRRRKH